MESDITFADLLNTQLNRIDQNPAWLAQRLNLNRSTVARWASGETHPRSPNIVSRIADLLQYYAPDEREGLFRAYNRLEAKKGSSVEPVRHAAVEDTQILPDLALSLPNNPDRSIHFLRGAARAWWYEVMRWEDAEPHHLKNWEGKVLWMMGSLTNRIKTDQLLAFLVAIGLWIATSWLLTPLLRWPLDSSALRQQAGISFGLASFLIPLLLALAVRPLDYDDFPAQSLRDQLRIFLLKAAGAFTGYSVFSTVLLLPVLVWHYFVGRPFSTGLCWLLCLLPLFLGYVAARRTPADRFHMFKGELRMHEADPLFLAVSIALGPLVAVFVYFAYPILIDGYFGFLLLLGAIGLLIWEHRKKHPDFLTDNGLIALLGIAVPLAIFVTIAVMPASETAPLLGLAPELLLLTAIYFLAETLLVVTLLVRNPPTLTLSGMLALLFVLLTALFVLKWNLLFGRLYTIALLLGWIGWGRTRFQGYHAVHPSFALLQVALLLSLFFVIRTPLLLWLNLSLFVLIAIGTVRWAYRHTG